MTKNRDRIQLASLAFLAASLTFCGAEPENEPSPGLDDVQFLSSGPTRDKPADCYSVNTGTPPSQIAAKCPSGTGHYQLKVKCTDELRGSSGWYYGAKVGIGQWSTVKCPFQGGVQWQITPPGQLLYSP